MFTLTLGLQVNEPDPTQLHLLTSLKETQNKGPDWDKYSCSDLANRIGKKLEQIGRLDGSQKTDAMMRAEAGGFIRWHILTAGQTCISSTHWDGCRNVFPASVTLEDHSEGMPVVLEDPQLRKLVRDFGSDLEQLRKLKWSQVADVWCKLEKGGFVERSQVQEAIQDNSSVSPGNYNTDASQLIQPFPSVPCLPISDPKTPGPNIPQTYADPDSWMDDVCNNESYPGSDLDRDLDACQKTDEGVLFMAPDTVSLGTPQPVAGIMSPAESISTPGLDGGASSYSTPSTMYYGSPEMGDRPVPGLAATIFNQAAETTSLISNRSMQSSTMPVATGSNQTILHFLQSYIVAQGPVQKEKRIQKVLQAEVHLITQDPCEMLRPLLGEWDDNILRGLHALGLPAVWKGIQGAVDYIRVLDADEAKPFLDPVARRIAQVLLSFNYAKLCGSQSKSDATPVLNCILDAYPDDPRISMSRQSRRNKISGYHVRRGRWWWKLAGTLGVGILLICDSSLTSIMCNNSFTNNQIDVLATFALNTRPGTIRVFRALESLVKSLMFGRVTDDLRHAILNDGLLSRHEMERAQNEDEVAVACQQIETPWTVVDVESCATKEMAEFLTSVPAT